MDVLPNFKVFRCLLVQNKYYKSGRMNFISLTNMDVGYQLRVNRWAALLRRTMNDKTHLFNDILIGIG